MRKTFFHRIAAAVTVSLGLGLLPAQAFTPSTGPAETQSVPGNMLLALSVEFPTGLQVSYTDANYNVTYSSNGATYEGYFDSRKCYSYDTTNEVFVPQSGRDANGACPTNTHWSGHLLNWLTMTNLDQFRSALTGGARDNFSSKNGTHPGDNSSRTVLIRSFSDRNSYNPVKNLSNAWVGLPTGYGTGTRTRVRSGGYGSKFFVSNGTFTDLPNQAAMSETCAASVARNLAGMTECFNIRVEVCKEVAASGSAPAVGRETNCIGPYGTSPTYYKPEGLLQEYSGSIRFGAMGYLNETGNNRNGGVLRAAMKSVGATNIGEGDTANSAREWTTDGFLVVNPNATDATASGVSQSGVINYLNKFGYAAGYKGNDPVGELYYASQLYLRNQPFPSSYTDNLDAAKKDGFPVITSFSNPIIRSCQKNFILGIGDIYTHCDGNLPNSPDNGSCPGGNPTDPNGVDTSALWTSVTTMEGSSSWVGGSGQGKPYMAGLAWWANTNDIQPNLAGKQTIATYWVDVLENNNGGAGIGAKTQFWLATKYGGFKQDKDQTRTNPNNDVTWWDNNGDGRPDTLFAGNSPAVLKASLRAAFAAINADSSTNSASSAAVTSNRQTSSSQVIYAGYDPSNWSGGVRACTPSQTAGVCLTAPTWEASNWFNATKTGVATPKLTDSTRRIFTSWLAGDGTFTDMPFLWASLNSSQTTILNSTDSLGSDRVSYLRGNRTRETATTNPFRKRADSLMGDVVNSNVSFLIGSGPAYRGTNFPGHAAYRTTNRTRPGVVYVGANDGMLHAFDASNGKELWGYIPSAVFANLPTLTDPNFNHRYFVDGTAMLGDTETGNSGTPWRTMLVGGLGGGGKGYYALDISGQAQDSAVTPGVQSKFVNMTETQLSAIPMWEFTSAVDTDLGYTYNEPTVDPVTNAFKQIAKVASATTATGAWRIIVGNGYGSSGNRAVLFMLNSETGAAATKLIATSSGTGDNGLSSPAPVDTDGDGLVDTVYAGDLRGRMHKFQFSKLATNGTDYVVAKSGDSTGVWRYIGTLYETGLPITAAPAVAPSCTGNGLQVLFGTGKLNENSDYSSTATNTFYSIADNGVSSSMTVVAADLATVTYTTSNGVRTGTAPDLTGKKGWKISFSDGERILSNPNLPPDTGMVLFGTSKNGGDLCAPDSSGSLNVLGVCTASAGLTLASGSTVISVGVQADGILKTSNTTASSSGNRSFVCNQEDCQSGNTTGCAAPGCILTNSPPNSRLSWRELLSR